MCRRKQTQKANLRYMGQGFSDGDGDDNDDEILHWMIEFLQEKLQFNQRGKKI